MPENQNIEWKSKWRDDYLEWICGFANAQGGTIYIGIDDNGHVIGLTNTKKLLEDIPNKVRNAMGIVVDVDLLSEDENEYIRITIPLTRWLFPVKEFITIEAAAPYRPCPAPSSNALFSESEVQHGIICRLLLLPLTTLTASLLNDLKNSRSKKGGLIKAFLMSLPMF